jgi:hypothetical protein
MLDAMRASCELRSILSDAVYHTQNAEDVASPQETASTRRYLLGQKLCLVPTRTSGVSPYSLPGDEDDLI